MGCVERIRYVVHVLIHRVVQPVDWIVECRDGNMESMFRNAKMFNQDLSKWNVSSVVDMSYMFGGAPHFSGDLSNWNVSKVTNMSFMFFFPRRLSTEICPIGMCRAW